MIKRREPRPLIAADGVTVLPPITLADLERDLADEDEEIRASLNDICGFDHKTKECVYTEDGLSASLRIYCSWKPKLHVYTLLDADDVDRVKTVNWRIVRSGGYRIRLRVYGRLPGGQYSQISRFIMGVTDTKLHVHHVQGNPLDNRKSMLEICTPKEHQMRHPRGYAYPLIETRKANLRYVEKNALLDVQSGARFFA